MSPSDPIDTPDSRQISVSARFAALPEVLAWVEHCAAAGGVVSAQSKRMQLAVEELFVNTLHHGHRGESDARISVSLDIAPGRATLTYSDQAPAFNLLEAEPLQPDRDRPGGVGLHLVRALAGSIRYWRSDDSNILEMEFGNAGNTLEEPLSD